MVIEIKFKQLNLNIFNFYCDKLKILNYSYEKFIFIKKFEKIKCLRNDLDFKI